MADAPSHRSSGSEQAALDHSRVVEETLVAALTERARRCRESGRTAEAERLIAIRRGIRIDMLEDRAVRGHLSDVEDERV